MSTTIGLIAPGEMGAAIGAAALSANARVVWASDGRSDASRNRADEAGLVDVGALADLVAASDVVLSVCPPHAAVEVARDVAQLGFSGRYVDANAVAPQTARSIATTVGRTGAIYVDGGIIGPPPHRPDTTRLYLAGQQAPYVAGLFEGGALEVVVLGGEMPAASALKMAYAGWTKGSAALLLSIRALAEAEGVEDDLIAEWDRSQPDLVARSEQAGANAAAKGWRWIGEMEEIADSLAAVGVPYDFHVASAEVYRRVAHLRTTDAPPLRAVIAALRDPT